MQQYDALDTRFTSPYPQEIMLNAVQVFGQRLAVLTRFTPADMVLLHMLADIAPRIPVLTLDTGEKSQHSEAVAAMVSRLSLHLIKIRAAAGSQALLFDRSLTQYDAWLVGHMAVPNKPVVPVLAHTLASHRVRIAPLARWSHATIQSYLRVYQLPGVEADSGSTLRPENPPARCQL